MLNALSEKSPNKVFISISLGALSGLAYSLLIPIVGAAFDDPSSALVKMQASISRVAGVDIAHYPLAVLFLIICVVVLVGRTLAQVILARVAIEVASELRMQLYRRVAESSLATLEGLGSARLITSVTADIPRIVMGAQVGPELMVSAVTLIGMMSFLFYLNVSVFLFVFKCILIGAITFQIPIWIARRYFLKVANSADLLHRSFNGLIAGIKEFKLNDAKLQSYLQEMLVDVESDMLASQKSGTTVMSSARAYGDMLSFIVIGVVTFIFVNYHALPNSDLVSIIMALLYVTGPIGVILNALPNLMMANVAYRRVMILLNELPAEEVGRGGSSPRWASLRLQSVCYQHLAPSGGEGFKVGPFTLEFHRGAITFIVGGNGSGKSTLCKLITMHYKPSSGSIYFDDCLLSNHEVFAYRQDMSAIYSNYHLFDKIYGKEVDLDELQEYLHLFQLDKKVSFESGKFSTLSLSDGQRRRLALVVAFIEDKELFLFDEWAADQDPEFKEVFYRVILPALRKKGKIVIVISHDDRYFDIADNIIKISNGVVISNTGCYELG